MVNAKRLVHHDLVGGGWLCNGHRVGGQVDPDVALAQVDERDLVLAGGRIGPVADHAVAAGRVGLNDAAIQR